MTANEDRECSERLKMIEIHVENIVRKNTKYMQKSIDRKPAGNQEYDFLPVFVVVRRFDLESKILNSKFILDLPSRS